MLQIRTCRQINRMREKERGGEGGRRGEVCSSANGQLQNRMNAFTTAEHTCWALQQVLTYALNVTSDN